MQRFGLGRDDLAGLPDLVSRDLAGAFATVFVVATVLVACCLVPAAFLPRRKPVSSDAETPVLLSH